MSDKLTALPTLSVASGDDLAYVVDVSDTTDDPAGTSKQITAANFGAKILIEEITLVSAGEFDFNNIPEIYNRFLLRGLVQSDTSASTIDEIHCYFNEDTTDSNYQSTGAAVNGGTSTSTEENRPKLGRCATTTSQGTHSDIAFLLEDPSGSSTKQLRAEIGVQRTSTDMLMEDSFMCHKTMTAVIVRLRIRTNNHPTDQLIGTLRLYGEM